jgi:uncharacterized protein
MPKLTPKDLYLNEEKSDKRYRTLSLVITKKCNLKCSYCYEKHNLRDSGIMDLNVAKKAITNFMKIVDEGDIVIIELFGGEPLLGYSRIEKIIEWFQEKEWKNRYFFLIATNGTLLNNKMKEFFARHSKYVRLGLSIDGNRKAHNISRDNSYDLIYPHIEFIKKNWPDQPSKMTICAETIPYVADSIIELEEMGIYFTANLPQENIWENPNNKKRLLKIYEDQLKLLVDYYVENSHLYPVYPILGILPTYLGIPELKLNEKKDCLRFCGAGHEMMVVDVDGSIYPCHRFLPWVSGKSGPIEPVNRQTSWKPDECNNCKIVNSCPTCAGYNWEVNGNTGIRTTYHCESHKLEVLAAAKIAALRFKKIPLSQLYPLTLRELNAMKDRVRSLLDLIEDGI